MFQVPKGMLQTKLTPNNKLNKYKFQVPKGMLQTDAKSVDIGASRNVSSPQGNATNFFE